MTEEEICRFYKSAKDKKTQITILSQLSGYPKEKVIAILKKNGLKIREEWERWLKKRLDNIDGKIKELEREYEEIAREIMAAPEEGGKN